MYLEGTQTELRLSSLNKLEGQQRQMPYMGCNGLIPTSQRTFQLFSHCFHNEHVHMLPNPVQTAMTRFIFFFSSNSCRSYYSACL